MMAPANLRAMNRWLARVAPPAAFVRGYLDAIRSIPDPAERFAAAHGVSVTEVPVARRVWRCGRPPGPWRVRTAFLVRWR